MFFRPICAPLILAQVIPIPDASMPDSEIVTPPPTLTVLEVVTPVANTSPSGLNVTPDPTFAVLFAVSVLVVRVVTIPVVAVRVVTIPVVILMSIDLEPP